MIITSANRLGTMKHNIDYQFSCNIHCDAHSSIPRQTLTNNALTLLKTFDASSSTRLGQK